MREIKFRVWNKNSKEFDRNGPFLLNGDELMDQGYFGDCLCCHDSMVLLQYTGLKNKSGKEIYEGDILRNFWDFTTPQGTHRFGDEVGKVIMAEIGEWSYDVAGGLNGEHITSLWHISKDSEIIGTIYKNPELLRS